MSQENILSPESEAKIKKAHDRFVAQLEKRGPVEGGIADNGDTPAERTVIEKWANDPETRDKDLREMGAK